MITDLLARNAAERPDRTFVVTDGGEWSFGAVDAAARRFGAALQARGIAPGDHVALAAGNSAGDREMLELAATGDRPGLCLLVDHDDAEREAAYESRSMTDPGAAPVVDVARRSGWTVISMRDDWSQVMAA